ncbi:hypothetical protein SAMN05216410_0208 [Sanguibacter gelidistatuariae]|uniref:Dolichyl-phosphate-mannose-protein mannosyltransferase n=1 Tax=Sanguibacter gelidistatuariae TaxID=1814289 RepID=A0A1G6XTY1_9MICO|nr:hypothetical protein SAMN05216410_0208 [Sanguibacter gelidistatuariae]
MANVHSWVVRALSSKVFLALVLLGCGLQYAWVAVSARLSIYDEPYHVAAIDAFSHRWLPFIDQTVADGPLGDAERYGSYLYHYLLSFPWRAARGLGMAVDDRIVLLRLLTVGIVVLALLVYRQVFVEMGASRAVAHVTVGLVGSLPLLVFLAGTVNYDNLMFLATALLFLYGLRVYRATEFLWANWLVLLSVACLGAVTKYTFLVLLPVVVIAVLVRQWSNVVSGLRTGTVRFFRPGNLRALTANYALLLITVVAVSLFAERYVGNLLQYGSLMPSCLSVHELAVCEMHAPWARNAALDAAYPDQPMTLPNAVAYLSNEWLPLMFRYSGYMGVTTTEGTGVTTVGPAVGGWLWLLLAPAGLAVLVLSAGVLRRIRGVAMMLGASALYLAVLFVQNLSDYLTLGEPVGIAGRYALVVLPVLIGLTVIGACRVLTVTNADAGRGAKLALLVGAALVLTQGGGITSYLWSLDGSWLRSDDNLVARSTLRAGDLVQHIILSDEIVSDPRL